MKELPKTYNPKEVEDEIYKKWEASGYFNPDNLTKASDRFWNAETFAIAMPPPNVTGNLHIGHSMFLTVQDIMVRHARMRGKRALWLPGTDHAAIATNYVVEREIWEKEKKTRFDLGRERFLSKVDEWVTATKGTIQTQIRKMGASCDWSREKYTLSDELSLAVKTAFAKMYEAGLIYRGKKMVNWCPRCSTTLSNDELDYKPQKSPFYHIRYSVAGSGENIIVATTRPETMLGDTAVAVNPKDARYKSLVGKSAILPLVNREIPIIADGLVDPKFGTGAVKVTPGHSEDDFSIAKRHNLEILSFITKEGKIDEEEAMNHGFEDYGGLTTEAARTQIISDLEQAGFLEKPEEIDNNVAYCSRCGTAAEPMISEQWFVSVDKEFSIQNLEYRKKLKLKKEKANLKEIGIAAVKSGAIRIVPKRFEKNYLNWMENLRDWNISRQIWFGHQLPVWYKREDIYVGVKPPLEDGWKQDEDTLDTWFSSSLWTFSTLGWPRNQSKLGSAQASKTELDLYHPTTIMETGYDILTFWVNRMIIMTGFALQDIPFKTVYLNGLVRDEKGRKMSKSLRNAIDPLEVIEEFGTDALRLSLIVGLTPGQDLKISKTKIAAYRNFANKLWNISRYVISANSKLQITNSKPEPQTLADEWILMELDLLIQKVNKHLDNHQYGLAGQELEEFTWNKFADWYLEISKISDPPSPSLPTGQAGLRRTGKQPEVRDSQKILGFVLQNLLRLWHPFIPFVTEHIWSQLSSEMLMVQKYPEEKSRIKNNELSKIKKFKKLQELITGLRNLRTEYQVKPNQEVAAYVKQGSKEKWADEQKALIEHLARVRLNEAEVPSDKKMPYFIWSAEDGAATKVYLIIPNFDPKRELKRTEKKLKAITAEVDKYETQLGNPAFTKNAPAEIVKKTKSQLTRSRELQNKLEEKIASLK